MKKIMKYKLVVFICITLQSVAAVAGTWLDDNARSLVSQYLDALTRGDTVFVLDVIGGDLLESRRSLLQNPEYSAYLIKAYSDTKISVIDSRQLTVDSIEVDASIERTVDEQFQLTFLVTTVKEKRETLQIVSERNIEK